MSDFLFSRRKMCQQDFDFGIVRSVGKMERRRESCNGSGSGSRKRSDSISNSNASHDEDVDDHNYHYRHHDHCQHGEETHFSCKQRKTRSSGSTSNSNNNMISPSLEEKNSLEDGSQGSEISGLDHQLPSMGKREISGVGEYTSRSSTNTNDSGTADTDTATTSLPTGCLSCSRERRRDDYGGNDFGECHHHHQPQHQLLLVKQQRGERESSKKPDDRDSSPILRNKRDDGLFNYIKSYNRNATEIIGESESTPVSKSTFLQEFTSSSSSASSDNPIPQRKNVSAKSPTISKSNVKGQRQQMQDIFTGMTRAMWIQLGMLILFSFSLQGKTILYLQFTNVTMAFLLMRYWHGCI